MFCFALCFYFYKRYSFSCCCCLATFHDRSNGAKVPGSVWIAVVCPSFMKDSFRIDNMLGLQVFPPPQNFEWVFFFLLCKISAEVAADQVRADLFSVTNYF